MVPGVKFEEMTHLVLTLLEFGKKLSLEEIVKEKSKVVLDNSENYKISPLEKLLKIYRFGPCKFQNYSFGPWYITT